VPDETLLKSLLNVENRHTKMIEEIARATYPLGNAFKAIEENSAIGRLGETLRLIEGSSGATRMAETVRLLEENSSIKQMMESLRLDEELTRTALGPMWELRQAGVLDPPWRRELGLATDAMDVFQNRFRLPEVEEAARLLTQFRVNSTFEELTPYFAQENSLRQAVESMRTPWLDIHESMKSLEGFAEIQGIGHALRSMPAFDENFAAALRLDLGDWRDTISWPPEIFTDLSARSEFYVGLGFNAALTDFPLPAFEQSLDIAGLRGNLPSFVEGYGSAVRPVDGDEEEGLTRTNTAHGRLLRLERLLRKFIDEEMTRTFGTDWPKHRLPNGLYDQWHEKKRKAEQAGAEERPLIEYADFTDYVPVICKADNWREVFGPFFNRPESVRESFQRLHPIRLDTMHARLITQDDELMLHVEVKRLVKVIVKRRNLS
jgi:HEPN superfamily Swt1-like protein